MISVVFIGYLLGVLCLAGQDRVRDWAPEFKKVRLRVAAAEDGQPLRLFARWRGGNSEIDRCRPFKELSQWKKDEQMELSGCTTHADGRIFCLLRN